MFDFNFKNYNPRNIFVRLSDFSKEFFSRGRKVSLRKEGAVFLAVAFVYFIFFASPWSFPVGTIVHIENGQSTQNIATQLKEKKVIKSKFLFEAFVRVFRGDKGVLSGDYFFEKHKNLFSVTYRMIKGIYGLSPIRVTIPEGLTVVQIADVLSDRIDGFDKEGFIKKSEVAEGYLFPDTYYFLPNISANDAMSAMRQNFNDKIVDLRDKIEKSGHSLKEIITMASILEEEGITSKDRKIISGVLWNRIKIGMPLQVDAVFPYIIGKNTYQVSLDDLKTDSPYNTYLNPGLPPGPITNPGFDSIVAALEPDDNDYLYYLSDKQHNVYYAKTFEEHKQNRILYLDK